MKTIILATTLISLTLSPSSAETWPSGSYKAQLQALWKCQVEAMHAYQRKEITHEENTYLYHLCHNTIMTKQWLEDYEAAHQ